MTRALRRRHRLTTLGLAIALPAGVVIALASRPPAPPAEDFAAFRERAATTVSTTRVDDSATDALPALARAVQQRGETP